ncbi:MAG: adenylate kinase [Actinomycetia bacterium]|nr:adenylate kinase [Actinomycetes bacterium]
MRLLITGAPGAGKGTLAGAVADHYSIPAISTGNMFRAAAASGSELGRQVGAIMASGGLVPDDVTDAVVAARLAEPDAAAGWLLDGYPRTLAQVKALDDLLAGRSESLDLVIVLDVPRDVMVARLVHRASIEGRADDTVETIRHRMEVYAASTAPILDAYAARDLVLTVDGDGTPDEVRERLLAALIARLGH